MMLFLPPTIRGEGIIHSGGWGDPPPSPRAGVPASARGDHPPPPNVAIIILCAISGVATGLCSASFLVFPSYASPLGPIRFESAFFCASGVCVELFFFSGSLLGKKFSTGAFLVENKKRYTRSNKKIAFSRSSFGVRYGLRR